MSKNKKFKKKIRSLLTTVGTLLLIIGVSVGVTLALLSAKTDKKENTFSGSKGVQGSTYENKWDNSSETSPSPQPMDADKPYYGSKEANPYTPGMIINKDPKVANLSKDQKIWVMMRVEYNILSKTSATDTGTKIPVKYSEFAKLARISTGDGKDLESGTHTGAKNEKVNGKWHLYKNGGTSDTDTKQKKLKTTASETDSDVDIDASLLTYYIPTEGSGANKHIYYYYYYELPLDKVGGTEVSPVYCSTDSLFDTVHINTQTADYDNIYLQKEALDGKQYSFKSPISGDTYFTYAGLPDFSITVESAIIATDPNTTLTTLTDGSKQGEIDQILTDLKSVFDAYDKAH